MLSPRERMPPARTPSGMIMLQRKVPLIVRCAHRRLRGFMPHHDKMLS